MEAARRGLRKVEAGGRSWACGLVAGWELKTAQLRNGQKNGSNGIQNRPGTIPFGHFGRLNMR
jgi:hypothetical protein